MAHQRYPMSDARRYIVQAFMRLNKARGLNLALLDLEYTDLMGWDFIKAHMYDKTLHTKFDVMLNEFIFKGHDGAMTNLDTNAGILDKLDKLSERDLIIIRCAYMIWRDYSTQKNEEVA